MKIQETDWIEWVAPEDDMLPDGVTDETIVKVWFDSVGTTDKPIKAGSLMWSSGMLYPITKYKICTLTPDTPATTNKYSRMIRPGVYVDVYDVLKAFGVTCPALQHLIKKALAAGNRGHKDLMTDLDDIIDSALRAKELASN